MRAKYADEKSGLNIKKILFEFLGKHAVNAFKRIIYNYYIRDFKDGHCGKFRNSYVGSIAGIYGARAPAFFY